MFFKIIAIMMFFTPGSLAPPGVAFNMSSDHAIHFFWSAPFTLNICDTEPDILYYTVDIFSDGAFSENVTTTDTEYVLHPDPCRSHMYRVEIAAVNVVGEGEKYISPEIDIEGKQQRMNNCKVDAINFYNINA